DGKAVSVKIRSMKPPVPAKFVAEKDETYIELDEAMEGISPGQACVFYDADDASRTLGGGWISRSE
ncbi:MAG: tRNA 2-thiouridine(34) synthase MnmA, partial [Acidimicrobiales bacterium]